MSSERERIEAIRSGAAPWRKWGPYLAERAWGTVREDTSQDGNAWDSFPHDHARSRAYRWNEDGMLGICDEQQRICIAPALWNGADSILKERMFGLTNAEGNHGEDAKEMWWYLDAVPSHAWGQALYRYPQRAFPYAHIVEENRRRGLYDYEFEVFDTGVFDENRFFDVYGEHAKLDPETLLIRYRVVNRGPDPAPIWLLPQVWFRNRWAWGDGVARPTMKSFDARTVELEEESFGKRIIRLSNDPELLFTENETNADRHPRFATSNGPFKDAFHKRIVQNEEFAVADRPEGTKMAGVYHWELQPGEERVVRMTLAPEATDDPEGAWFDEAMAERKAEADAFYAEIEPTHLSEDGKDVMRRALGGMLWGKQYYHFDVHRWMKGDETAPGLEPHRQNARNASWTHLRNEAVISMPDKWEYPWYAAWDSAFHCVALAVVDSDYAKDQLLLFLKDWYLHPNGQIPAYEWNFGDVNPPVHAWAVRRVYTMERKRRGQTDRDFLERAFHKLLLNFTWWVNRKDRDDNNVFQGGFLGLDNIGVFDRSAPLPLDGYLEQADGTSWMAFFSLNMLWMACELSRENDAYEDLAIKFWEHFLYIAAAMNDRGEQHLPIWDDEDGFYYDLLKTGDGRHIPLKVRSLVGLIPLLAVDTLDSEVLERMPRFKARVEEIIDARPDLTRHVACMRTPGRGERRLLSIVDRSKLERVLEKMLDPSKFYSDHGVRSLSKWHAENPFVFSECPHLPVKYVPAESTSTMFGGNSNWRGPVWFPINYLLIESLQKYDHYFGEDFQIECPSPSGERQRLSKVAADISRRLSAIFLLDGSDRRPCYGADDRFQSNALWRDNLLFHEYFNGDNGAGLGASHQTGWTGLVAKLLQQSGEPQHDSDSA